MGSSQELGDLLPVNGSMDAQWSSSSAEVSDYEYCLEDSKDEEEFLYGAGYLTKLQFRKVVLKACWKDDLAMAEVIEHKGRMLTSMGIVRNGKIYCSIEESLFLAEIGALLLVDDKDTSVPIKAIYEKIAEGKSGCTWEALEVYRHLKTLGYIVGRYGIPWSLKSLNSCSMPLEGTLENDDALQTALGEASVVQLLSNLSIRELRPDFEVYLPNSKFRKTSPGNPSFVVSLARGLPPSRSEIEEVKRQCNGIPVKVCHAEHGRFTFFSFDKVDLPFLP